MKLIPVLLLVLAFVPIAAQANTIIVPVPALPVTVQTPFVVAHKSLDGGSIIGGTTEYTPWFGDASSRNSEIESASVAPFNFNVTNFYVLSPAAACNGLGAGETLTVTLRINEANTALTGSCASGAAANSFTLDTDVVAVTAGQRLSISYTLTGTILSRSFSLAVGAMGYTYRTGFTPPTNVSVEFTPTNVTVTFPDDITVHTPDATLLSFAIIAPLLLLAIFLISAEVLKSFILYLVALILCGNVVVAIWEPIAELRFAFIVLAVYICYRMWLVPHPWEEEGGI